MKREISAGIVESLRKFYHELTVGLDWLVIWLISNIASGDWQSYDEYMEEKGYHKVGRYWEREDS